MVLLGIIMVSSWAIHCAIVFGINIISKKKSYNKKVTHFHVTKTTELHPLPQFILYKGSKYLHRIPEKYLLWLYWLDPDTIWQWFKLSTSDPWKSIYIDYIGWIRVRFDSGSNYLYRIPEKLPTLTVLAGSGYDLTIIQIIYIRSPKNYLHWLYWLDPSMIWQWFKPSTHKRIISGDSRAKSSPSLLMKCYIKDANL